MALGEEQRKQLLPKARSFFEQQHKKVAGKEKVGREKMGQKL